MSQEYTAHGDTQTSAALTAPNFSDIAQHILNWEIMPQHHLASGQFLQQAINRLSTITEVDTSPLKNISTSLEAMSRGEGDLGKQYAILQSACTFLCDMASEVTLHMVSHPSSVEQLEAIPSGLTVLAMTIGENIPQHKAIADTIVTEASVESRAVGQDNSNSISRNIRNFLSRDIPSGAQTLSPLEFLEVLDNNLHKILDTLPALKEHAPALAGELPSEETVQTAISRNQRLSDALKSFGYYEEGREMRYAITQDSLVDLQQWCAAILDYRDITHSYENSRASHPENPHFVPENLAQDEGLEKFAFFLNDRVYNPVETSPGAQRSH